MARPGHDLEGTPDIEKVIGRRLREARLTHRFTLTRPPPPPLIIVSIDRMELRSSLPTKVPRAQIVVDRRRRDRRWCAWPVAVNRRRVRDRRRRLTEAEAQL